MAFDLASISAGTRNRAPRIILLGVEKIGKSTFASQSPNPIFLPLKGEEGIDSIDVPQFPTCNTLDDLMTCLGTLYTETHDYHTVVIDSASALEPLIWEDVCRRCGNVRSIEEVGGGYAKGYVEAAAVWRQLTAALDALRAERGMASILIGHVKVKRFDDPAGDFYDQYQWDVHDRAANLLYRWADVLLFANTKVVVKSEKVGFGKEHHRGIEIAPGSRWLYTQKRPAHPGGGRGVYGQLEYELPLTWQAFQDAVAAAM
jgi:hypothetical protein